MAKSGSDEMLIMEKNLSNEAFKAGKEMEAMKRLMLHRIALSLLLLCLV